MAAAIFRGLRTNFLLQFICIHDFDSYPPDRELSYDFEKFFVMLVNTPPQSRTGEPVIFLLFSAPARVGRSGFVL